MCKKDSISNSLGANHLGLVNGGLVYTYFIATNYINGVGSQVLAT